jgi:peptide/nickel transport system permease protein
VLYGARVSLWIGFVVALLSGLFGATFGILAAQFRRLDPFVMRVMDALMSFPAILLALGVTAALGPRMESVMVALTVAYDAPKRLYPCIRRLAVRMNGQGGSVAHQ